MKPLYAFLFSSTALLFCGCSEWTRPEALSYDAQITLSEEYLTALRAFKQSEHKVVILGMDGTADTPTGSHQHPMNLPDSADYIYIRNLVGGLHSNIAAEIAEVYNTKGTKVLADVDYISIEDEWLEMQDAKEEAGETTGTEEEFMEFCTERTGEQLACMEEYGCHGIMISYTGAASFTWALSGRTAFFSAILDWYDSHSAAEMLVRGNLILIPNSSSGGVSLYDWNNLVESCKYTIYPIDEETSASGLNNNITRIFRYYSSFPSDRLVLEATVPTVDDGTQVGMSPSEAASYVLTEHESFTKVGLAIENTQDDYFNLSDSYINVRGAITILNTTATE